MIGDSVGSRHSHTGQSIKRKEDPRLITGSGCFVDDLDAPSTGYVAVLRSYHPHAIIEQIDTSAARSAPGIIAVYTGRDLHEIADRYPERIGPPGHVPIDTWPLAIERVRYAGEPVAVVVAADRYQAYDALELIDARYTPLRAVVDVEAALAPDAPLIHEEAPGNLAFVWQHRHGDPDTAIAEADVVIEQKLLNQRIAAIPIEPRGAYAEPDRRGPGLTLTTSTQTPHLLRRQLATSLRLPESVIRVIAPDVGGGFGVKLRAYPEDIIVGALALHLGRPIKWIETRSENLATTHHGRAQLADITIAAKQDGTITALRLRCLADIGSHPRGVISPTYTGPLMNGVYRFEHVDLEITGVYTNTMATGAYRGAGRPEAAYFLERMVDLLADKLGIDRIELRRRNFIPANSFPYHTASGSLYDSGDYARALDRLIETSDFAALQAEQECLRARGRLVGIGIGTFTEVCGLGPHETAHVRVEPDGSVAAATGISPHGQGQETSFAQITADELGVSMDKIRVIHGDTAQTPAGGGTYGSRGLSVGGSALLKAIEIVRGKAVRIAAHLLESAEEDIVLLDDYYVVRGAPDRRTTLAAIAKAAYGDGLPPGIEPGFEAVGVFQPAGHDFPFGAHLAMVDVDRDTGHVRILRYVAVDDCGNVVNPLLVDGQIHGGLAQGIGQALWEAVVYDESGQLLSGTLMDYAVPKASYFPTFENSRTVTPTTVNPLGAKGIGELATVGSTVTVVNAVVDALRPLGVKHVELPLRPETVWRAIQQAGQEHV